MDTRALEHAGERIRQERLHKEFREGALGHEFMRDLPRTHGAFARVDAETAGMLPDG